MRQVWLWILGFFIVWPIHSTVATIGTKPIDMMLSDLMVLLMPLTYFIAKTRPSKLQLRWTKVLPESYAMAPLLTLAFIVYAISLAGIGLGISGETIRIYTAFKLVKPMAFIFVGYVLGSWVDPLELIDAVSKAFGVIVGLTMFFTVTAPAFPVGDWGKYIFEYELSGWPNSPMSYFAVMTPLLIAASDLSRNPMLRLAGKGLAVCSVMMILGSMSRSSALAMICAVTVYLVMTGRFSFLLGFGLVIFILSVIGFWLFSALRETEVVSVLVDRVQMRFDRSLESEDPSSGRYDIWALAIELWTEKPIFGYMFESFSHYAVEVDTPHQQYLEVLYKCGGLGLTIYLGMLASFVRSAFRLFMITEKRSRAWYQLSAVVAMMSGILVGNLTQPNLTYSLTGNTVFVLIGCLCSSRAMVSASQPSRATQAKSEQKKSSTPQRLAA